MESNASVSVRRFQWKTENILILGAVLLLAYHMLLSPYMFVVANYRTFLWIECAFGLILLSAALLTMANRVVHQPDVWLRVRGALQRFFTFEQAFLVFYFFWYILVVLIRQFCFGQGQPAWHYFLDNGLRIFHAAEITFILFPLAGIIGNRRMEKLVPNLLKAVLIPNIVFHAWVLWQYLHLNFIIFPSGRALEMDFEYSLRIGYNRNMTGAIAVTMLALCLYLVVTRRGWRKLPYCLGAAVYYITLVYSNCRTSWYVCLLLAVAVCIFGIADLLKSKKPILRYGAGLGAAVLILLLLRWTRTGLFHVLGSILMHAETLPPAITHFDPSALDALTRTYSSGLSGREDLYRACLYVMTHDPYCFFFGVTPTDVGRAVYGLCGVDVVYTQAHNFFLQMGMSYGVPAMLLTIAFTISLAVRSFRILFRSGAKCPRGSWMLPVTVFCILAQDMMESFLNSGGTMVTVAFYLFAGWLVALDRKPGSQMNS